MPAVGDLLADRYRIDGVLGAGGMATVYAATDLRLERQVAVKVLLPNFARDPSLAERFDREARILASVSHSNVAEVFDVERGDPDSGREPFYVMELCDGGSLASRIEAGGPLEPGALVPIIVSVAAALGELHRRGLIHRDVKPANILFTGGRPKLADFGLAKSGGAVGFEMLTAPGTAIGTPAYMAPELVVGGDATAASDVYALGATTFHGLTGHAPRQAETLTSLATTADQAVTRVSDESPRLGRAFDDVVGAALADDPASRPSLNAFTAGLVAALEGPGDTEAVPVPAAPEPAVPEPAASEAARTEGPPDFDPLADTTRIDISAVATVIAPPPVARPAPAARRRSARRPIPVGSALLAFAFVGVAVLALSGLSSLWQAAGQVATAAPSAGDSSIASATPLASPTPSASPAASPSPTADPAADAIEALGPVLTAIDKARGGPDGLSGGEARELTDTVLRVGSELRAGAYDDARNTALELDERARKLADNLDKKEGEALLGAIEDLLAAIPN